MSKKYVKPTCQSSNDVNKFILLLEEFARKSGITVRTDGEEQAGDMQVQIVDQGQMIRP